jgi:hypothetical protein
MDVHGVSRFVTTYQGGIPATRRFQLSLNTLSKRDQKTLSSAAVRFNLTTEVPLICSLKTRQMTVCKSPHEILSLQSAVLSVFLVVTLCFGAYRYKDIPIDSIPYFGAFKMGFALCLIMAGRVFSQTIDKEKIFYRTVQEITVTFTRFERQLPNPISNRENATNTAWIDPISLEEIPKDQALLPRYVHVANTVMEVSNCLKMMLQKDLRHDSVDLPRFRHPLENHRLNLENLWSLEDQLTSIFHIPRDRYYKSQIYDLWNVTISQQEIRQQIALENPNFLIGLNTNLNHPRVNALAIQAQQSLTQRKRELNFVRLYEGSILEHLPSFQVPK